MIENRGQLKMKEVKWQVQEEFLFQPNLQKPQSIKQLTVTPQFVEEIEEGRPKISGIYHVAMTCALLDEKMETVALEEECIIIDTIDQQDNDGYFEYAVPFHIDFPPEAAKAVQVNVHDAHANIDKQGHIVVTWDVECTYEVEGIQKRDQKIVTEKERDKQLEKHEEKIMKTDEKKAEESFAEKEQERPKKEKLSAVIENKGQQEYVAKTEEVERQDEESQVPSDDHVRSFFQQLKDGTSKKSFHLS